ncbi:hypothetical protein ACSBR2_021904 [Camellia fascicularis]
MAVLFFFIFFFLLVPCFAQLSFNFTEFNPNIHDINYYGEALPSDPVIQLTKFSNKELAIATKNFVEEEKPGQGGIDSIYRGFLRDLNSYVAVKRVSRESTQGIKELSHDTVVLTRRMGTMLLHIDIKLSNIMLDSNFNAKLENFGLANLVDHGKGSQTRILPRTMEYMAPECLMKGKANLCYMNSSK